MRRVGVVALLLLAAGCATTRVVHLDVGNGQRVTHESVEVEPVEVSEDEFKAALRQLILDMRLDVAFRETDEADQRGWVRSRTLLASSKGLVDSGSGTSPESLSARLCADADDCLSLVGGTGLPFGRKDRTLMALSFALDTVWESVEVEVGKLLNPVALKAMLTSAALTMLLTVTLPEPVTRLIAVGLTAALVAYLGVIPVWEMGRGFVRLWEDSGKATSVIELQDIGHRFGRVLGTNGTRILVLLVTAALGGKSAMAAQGPKLPGFAQAAIRARAEGGFQWTPVCEAIFKKAGMTLEDVANKVRLKGHEGPHPELYHKKVASRLQDAVSRCKTTETCRARLVSELAKIANDLLAPGSELRSFIVK